MSAARFQWGKPPWARGPDLAPASKTSIPTRPDVAIIGAGMTGTSTALHLAKRGIQSITFEAGLVGDGASGRTGGLVLEGTATGPRNEVNTCVTGLERVALRVPFPPILRGVPSESWNRSIPLIVQSSATFQAAFAGIAWW